MSHFKLERLSFFCNVWGFIDHFNYSELILKTVAVCFTAVATSKSDVYFGSWWVGDAEFWLHLIDNINDGNCAAEDELHQESYTIEMFLVNCCFPPESHFSCEIKISIFWAPTSVIFDWPDVSITSCYPISMQRLGFTVRVKSVKMFCTLTGERLEHLRTSEERRRTRIIE